MNTTGVRVIIDTNVLVAIISKNSPSRWIFDLVASGKIQICFSTDILLEYNEILQIKTNSKIAENIVNFLISNPFAEQTDIFYNFNLIEKDSTDNKFVDCAISGNTEYIISNDKHFQILKTIGFPKVKVLTVVEFEKRFKKRLM